MALSDEILADLAKKKGGAGKGPPMPPMKGAMKPGGAAEDAADNGADDAEETSYGSDEEQAMADFESAKDPAGKVEALKAFMSICYPQLDSMKA